MKKQAPKRRKTKMTSDEHRASISEAMFRYWRKRKKAERAAARA